MSSRVERVIKVIAAVGIGAFVLAANRVDQLSAQGQPAGREQIKEWTQRSKSVAISIETPAWLDTVKHAYAVPGSGPAAGQHIPLMIEVATFTDFECPVCRVNDSVTMALASRYRAFVVRSLIHFPQRWHPHALESARAFECADMQGHGKEMARALFKAQPEFGTRPWTAIATEAQVDDRADFATCMAKSTHDARIWAGVAFAEQLNLHAIPTVVVDGWIITPPSAARIEDAINDVIRRRMGRCNPPPQNQPDRC